MTDHQNSIPPLNSRSCEVFCLSEALSLQKLKFLVAMTLGLGRHLWDVPRTQAVEFGEVKPFPQNGLKKLLVDT